jgi:hypothetical protein
MSEIGPPPLPSDIIGPFGPNISFFVHQGQFKGRTSMGDFITPYWITTPVNPEQADGVCIFEPQHTFDRSIALDVVFGAHFLLAGGASHATVEHRRPGGVEDVEILREFARALRQSPHVIQRVEKIYGMGFSQTGNIMHKIYRPFGHEEFDLTFACLTSYNEAYSPPVNISANQNPIIIFGTENEFHPKLIQHVAQNASFPKYRWYTVAAAPHIPDTPLARNVHTDPPKPPVPVPLAGTTPIRWDLFIRGLLVAGHEWIKDPNNKQPPPSVTLRMAPEDPTVVQRDYMGNAVGGIRHPALETREATFLPTVLRGNWPLFGGRGNERRIQDLGGFDNYFRKFEGAVRSLVAAKFLRSQDGEKLLRNVQLNRANTFTRSYAAGLFV